MVETFFENPLYIYFALALAELVLVVIWYEKRTSRWVLSLVIPVVLAGVVGLVAHLVVTDRERIIAAVKDIARSVESGQLQQLPDHLDRDFTARLEGLRVGKRQVVALCNSRISRWRIRRVSFAKMKVEVASEEAKMHVVTILTYGEDSRRTPLIWDAVWIKRGGSWLILRVAEPKHGIEF